MDTLSTSITTPDSLDRYDISIVLETLATKVRGGQYDIQKSFGSVQIITAELDGFQIQISGQIQALIVGRHTLTQQALRLLMERDGLQGSYIETIVEEAFYAIDNYVDGYSDELVPDVDKFITAELLYGAAIELNQDSIFDMDSVGDTVRNYVVEELPREAFLDER